MKNPQEGAILEVVSLLAIQLVRERQPFLCIKLLIDRSSLNRQTCNGNQNKLHKLTPFWNWYGWFILWKTSVKTTFDFLQRRRFHSVSRYHCHWKNDELMFIWEKIHLRITVKRRLVKLFSVKLYIYIDFRIVHNFFTNIQSWTSCIKNAFYNCFPMKYHFSNYITKNLSFLFFLRIFEKKNRSDESTVINIVRVDFKKFNSFFAFNNLWNVSN